VFPSLSKCAPGVITESEFTATYSFSLDISPDIEIYLDGDLVTARPIGIEVGENVKARFFSPLDFLDHVLIPYTIDGIGYSFAAVNKSQHTVFFSSEIGNKRWWEIPTTLPHVISYRNNSGNKTIFRDLGYNAVSVLQEYEAIPDPQTSTVYFYNADGVLIENLLMPAKPIQCTKYISEQESFFIVSCDNGFLYRVNPNLQILEQPYLEGGQLISRRRGNTSDWLFLLSFEIDVPFKGSFVNLGGSSIEDAVSEEKYVSCANGRIWVGGPGKIWVLNPDFSIMREFTTYAQCVGIQALDNAAVATTKYGTVELVDLEQTSNESLPLYEDEWLTNPVKFGDYIAIGNSTRSSLILINAQSYSQSEIELGDFAPSYLCKSGDRLYISGHDTNIIKIYDGALLQEDSFADKVTWVQTVGDGVIVSHYLRGISVLEHDRRQTVIPFQLPSTTAPLTWVGGGSHKIINLGQESIPVVVPEGVRYWSDGVENGLLNTGSIFTVAARIDAPRTHLFPVIIGDTVLEFQITGSAQTYSPRDINFPTVMAENGIAQHDFYYPDGYQPVIASIDCGHLLKNFRPYMGEPITPGDVVSVCIPFGNSVNPVVSTFTLGDSTFCIPVNPVTVSTHILNQTAAAINSTSSASYTITQAGDYYFPPNDETVSSVEIQLLGRPIFNLGAATDSSSAISNLTLYGSTTQELADLYARVSETSGLFDVYFDAGTPHVLTSYYLMPRWGDVQLTPEITVRQAIEIPVNFKILASNDATTWVELATFSGLTVSEWEENTFREFQFSNNQAYRYWRLQNTTTQDGGVSIVRWKVKGSKKDLEISINGVASTPGLISLSAGDTVLFKVGNSPRIWDSRHAKIVGPQNITFTSTTVSLETISYLDCGSIADAYVRLTYDRGPVSIITSLDSVELKTFSPYLKLRKNSEIEFVDTLTVQNGDTVSVRKIVRNLFEDRAAIFNQQEDPTFEDTVNVEVGSLSISSDDISGALYYNSSSYVNQVAHPTVTAQSHTTSTAYDFNLSRLNVTSATNEFDAKLHSLQSSTSPRLAQQLLFNNTFSEAGAIQSQITTQFTTAFSNVYGLDLLSTSSYSDTSYIINKNTDAVDRFFTAFNPIEYHEELKFVLLPPSVQIYLYSRAIDFYTLIVFETHHHVPTYSIVDPHVSLKSGSELVLRPIPVLESIKSISELVLRAIPVHDSLLDHDSLTELAVFNTHLGLDNKLTLSSFTKMVSRDNYVDLDVFETYISQLANKLGSKPLAIHHGFNHILFDHYSFLAPKDQFIHLNRYHSLKSEQVVRILDGMNTIPIDDIIWTTDEINEYGAFATDQEAADAALVAGHTPVIVFQIPGTSSFTYRRLSNITQVCGIIPVPSIYAVAWLIQGG